MCHFQIFDGNSDSYNAKHSYLDEPISTRYVKFHTIRWHSHPSMRVEVIGCQGKTRTFKYCQNRPIQYKW
jgi:hypothetical protein